MKASGCTLSVRKRGETALRHCEKLRIAGAFFCLALCTAWPLAAQEAGPPAAAGKEKAPPAESAEPAARPVEESHPSIFYLKDKQGNLQAVPNFTLEDFEELYKLKHQLVEGDPRPRYSLQQMLATGTVNAAGQAELTVQCRILVRDEQWTRIPLRLDQAVLREPAQYQGPGEHFVTFEGEGEGYVAWIRGPAEQSHQLTLKMLVPVTALGPEMRLRLLAPRATASELRFKVPYAKAAAKVSEGATLQPSHTGAQETELVAVGLSGDFELTWRPPDALPGKPAALEAFANIASRLDAHGVETEATLSVRSYGEAFDRFRVRLPPDAELTPGNPNGYTLTVIDAGHGTNGAARSRTVEVQLARRTVGPVEIHLSTKREADMSRGDAWLELAGFEVPEAARQWGTIAVSVAGDWQVLWGSSRGVRQIDQPPEALRQKDVVAAYDYFSQPLSLTARLVTRKTRIGVEPEYVVQVDSDQIHLDARLRYAVRGAKVSAVDIAMPEWQIDEVGPDSVVAVDGVPTGAAGAMLSLPLVSPTIGPFEIRLKAHRPLAADAKSFSIVLPQPQASAPAAAVVAVVPADNVEIVPGSQTTTGLLRQQAAVPLELPVRQQETLFYRSAAPKAVFSAEVRRHRQRITASVNSQVTLEPAGGRVVQKFSYVIAYEPTDFFLLEVPRELAAPGRLALSCEDQVLAPVVLGDEADDGANPVRIRVALPKSCIGRCELTARYALTPFAKGGGDLHIPLAMPLEAEFAGNNLAIAPGAEQDIDVAAGDWTLIDGPLNQTASPRTRELSATKPVGQVVVKLRGEGGDAAVVVEREWLQTSLTRSGSVRQDHLFVQFTTRRRQIEITLPPGAARDQATVQLNGSPVAAGTEGDRILTVPLSADGEPPRYALSVQYHADGPAAWRGAKRLDFPRLGDDAWTVRMYWQLLLPSEEHLIVAPRGFTSEFVWHWNSFYFGRQPVMGQADLEAWMGLHNPGNTPALSGMNSYLFSSLGPVDSCEIVTAGRSTIVLLASGLVLLAGLALIYIRAARRPAVLLAAAVLLAGGAAISPELAVVAAQASAVGLVLVVLALFLRQWTAAARPVELVEAASAVKSTVHAPRPSEAAVPVVAAAGASGSSKAIAPSPPDVAV